MSEFRHRCKEKQRIPRKTKRLTTTLLPRKSSGKYTDNRMKIPDGVSAETSPDTARTVPSKDTTVYDVLTYWLEYGNVNRKRSTSLKYTYLIDNHIAPELGDLPADRLSSAAVNGFISQKLSSGRLDGEGGLSDSYVRTMSIIIQSAYTLASEDGLIAPTRLKVTKPAIKKKSIPLFSEKNAVILENQLRTDLNTVKLGTMISLYTGMRIGEVCALSWEDVDLKENVLRVRHTVSRVQGAEGAAASLCIDTPKTEASQRDIPIPSVLRPYLLHMKEISRSAFVVSDREGFISPRTYEYRYHKLLKKCGIPDVNYHALRHTFATRCVAAGVDIKTLSEILGHSNVSVTLNTYVHPSFEAKRQQLEKLFN